MSKHKDAARFLLAAIAMMLLIAFHSAAQSVNVSESELQFRDALHKQTVEGDLTSAMKIYQNIIASKTADRGVKAKALFQLAVCYEKLGQKSEAVYQQIVRDYSDQPVFKDARAKLAAFKPPAPAPTLTMRKIEMGAGVQNVVATDGQRAVYWDSTNTTLYIGDVAGKEKRIVYQTQRAPRVFVSRDLSMAAFYFPETQQNVEVYAIIKTDGTGYRELKLTPIIHNRPTWLTWSWDNRLLLVCASQLLKVAVADGTFVDLLPDHKTAVLKAEFSPDNRLVAYNEGLLGRIHLIRAQGGEPQIISQEALLGDWTRDGRYLIFTEARQGAAALSAVPIQNGRASGDPIPVRASLPAGAAIPRIVSNGAMVLPVGGASFEVSLGTLDRGERRVAWQSVPVFDAATGGAWSPDGRQFAYVARGSLFSLASAVRVQNVVTGEDRELYRANGSISSCVWARQHPTLYCGRDVSTNTEILSIAMDSGRAEKVGVLDGSRILHLISADDRILSTSKPLAGRGGHDWEIGTNRETDAAHPATRSPDGRFVFGYSRDSQNLRVLQVRPAQGGENEWKQLAHLRIPGLAAPSALAMRFTFDGDWIVYQEKDASGKDALYRVATSGEGEPQRLGDYPSSVPGWFTISPDGHQFLVAAPGPPKQPEFWMLENFLPAAAKAVTK